MKKYDMSIIDLSEISNITVNVEKLQNANEKMKEMGLLNENGSVNESAVKSLVNDITVPLFGKLSRRIRRYPDGMMEVYENVASFVERGEITALYFYVAFIYGFLQWRVPQAVSLLPADDKALEAFAKEFKNCLSRHINSSDGKTEE